MPFTASMAAARSVRSTRIGTHLVQQQRFFTPVSQLRVRHQSPEETEKAKQEQLKKQAEGKGHHDERLASTSESHVKADRENVKDHDEHIENLQEETAKSAKKEKS